MKEVLQKFISSSGLCSRRRAEEFINQGKVVINGKRAELGMRAGKEDEVTVNGKKLEKKEKKIYIKLNKPIGYTCTNRKFKNEKNIFDIVKGLDQRMFVAGRLDKNTRGLTFLTNDGAMAERITHPRYGHEKEYILEVGGFYEDFDIKKFIRACLKGFEVLEIGKVKMKKIECLGENKFKVTLDQGKKRQIRRMFEKFGLGVKDLKRIKMNTLELGDLPEGQWSYLTEKEINDLM